MTQIYKFDSIEDANNAMAEMDKQGWEVVSTHVFNYTAMEHSEVTGQTIPRPIPIFFITAREKILIK